MRYTEAEYLALQASRQTPAERAIAEESERAQAEALAEAEIEGHILDYLRFLNIPFTKTKAELSRRSSEKIKDGWPDITGCYQSKMLAIEVKAATGKLRKSQVEMLSRLWQAGALVVIARCVSDVQQAIKDGKHPASAVELSKALLNFKK